MLPAKAIEVCRANKWLKTQPYVRANGRHCADICVTDPVTGAKFKKQFRLCRWKSTTTSAMPPRGICVKKFGTAV